MQITRYLGALAIIFSMSCGEQTVVRSVGHDPMVSPGHASSPPASAAGVAPASATGVAPAS